MWRWLGSFYGISPERVENDDMTVTGFIISDTVHKDLTKREMVKDFETAFKTITQNSPVIDDFKDIYGYSFADRKNMYLSEIEKCENNAEFYGTMSSVLSDIPSCHTYIQSPEYYSVFSFCYGAERGDLEVLSDKELAGRTADYENDLIKAGEEYSKAALIECSYKNNGYVIPADNSRLLEIEGISVHDYIRSEIFYNKIQYDFGNSKPFRSGFNLYELPVSNLSREVNIKLETADNEVCEKKMYLDFCADAVLAFYSTYAKKPVETAAENKSVLSDICYTYYDRENDTGYVNITVFDVDAQNLCDEALSEIAGCENVIIDLRMCGGGHIDFLTDYFYGKFFRDDIKMEYEAYRLWTNKNNHITFDYEIGSYWRDVFNKQKYPDVTGDNKSYIYSADIWDYKGSGGYSPNVYLLISNQTASAADAFADTVKSGKLGTVIGTNTMGEGRGIGYCIDKLPCSKLIFSYNPSLLFNLDGTNNSVYGTAPDHYIPLDENAALLAYEISSRGGDPYTYENRLEWDNTLNAALAMINECS